MTSGPGEFRTAVYEDLSMALQPETAAASAEFLHTLSSYLLQGQFMLRGDLALTYHAWRAGVEPPYRLQDHIEVAVSDIDAVDPNITADFFILHNHPGNYGDNFYLYILSREYPHMSGAISAYPNDRSVLLAPLGDLEVPIGTPESMYADIVLGLQRVMVGTPATTADFCDAYLLSQIVDPAAAEAAWNDLHQPGGISLEDAHEQAKKKVMDRTGLLTERPGVLPVSTDCPECVFPVYLQPSPVEEIHRVLGVT